MQNNLEVLTSIDDVQQYFTKISEDFDALQTILDDLKTKTDSTDWSGKTHDRCVDANEMLGLYCKALSPFCIELKECCKKLSMNVDAFVVESDNINDLKGW